MDPGTENRLKQENVSLSGATQILFSKLEKLGDNCVYLGHWHVLEMAFVMFEMRKIKTMQVK